MVLKSWKNTITINFNLNCEGRTPKRGLGENNQTKTHQDLHLCFQDEVSILAGPKIAFTWRVHHKFVSISMKLHNKSKIQLHGIQNIQAATEDY